MLQLFCVALLCRGQGGLLLLHLQLCRVQTYGLGQQQRPQDDGQDDGTIGFELVEDHSGHLHQYHHIARAMMFMIRTPFVQQPGA